MKITRVGIVISLLLMLALAASVRAAEVQAREGSIDLPTYLIGDEDPNPPFPLVTRHRVYPYTMLDDLTDRREMRNYKALYLENEYLRAIVLPEMGGRLYSLYDKVAQREVFYRNNVVKYGLIALRGAWVSGGVEFNFPDGHTAVTVSPVASTLLHNADGSATVVVADVDRVTGMHWEVALTLRPGQARLEQHVTLYNLTPLTSPYSYRANAAVPATEDAEFIYPMREAFPHTKGVVWTYPVHDGIDYRWYKNVRAPTSLLGRNVHRNFFGVYYHKSDYGVVHVAHFREVPGKKYWTWGVAGDGLIWTDLLTDSDGPYNEIQSGRYETRLNYEFMPPRRVEAFTEYWYPVHALGDGFVEARPQLALNVRFRDATPSASPGVDILVSPAVTISSPKVRVKLGSETLQEFQSQDFTPLKSAKFFLRVADLEDAKKNLAVQIESSDGHLLLSWSAADPVDGNPDFAPAAGVSAAQPKSPKAMSVEELFLFGLEREKDGAEEAAQEIYRQVLERDAGYIPALLKQAWRHYRSANFLEAEGFIFRAMARNSLDPSVHYAAGVIYRASQRWTLAADAFWAAIHFGGPPGPAFAQLGELAIHQKEYAQGAALLRKALSYNPDDAMILTDLAVALRLAGRSDEARDVLAQALEKMPLLPWALAERWQVARAANHPGAEAPEPWASHLTPGAETYLDLAVWYRSLGDLASSDAVLEAATRHLPEDSMSPLVYYYLASNAWREGKNTAAEKYARQAASARHEKVFPHRIDDALVLLEALQHNALDAHGQYFLGNFLFSRGRYEDASRLWLQALGQGFEYSVLARNLGLYAWRVKKDLRGAAGFFEQAVKLAPEDFRLYVDLDEIYAQLGDTARRETLLRQAPGAVLDRDTVRVRRALLFMTQRQYAKAVEILMDHNYKPWEGEEIVRRVYVAANLEQGKASLAAGRARDAEEAFRRATEYPVNLGVGKPDEPHDEEAFYWLGQALKAGGNDDAARQAWEQAAAVRKGMPTASRVFRAVALRELGKIQEAEKILGELAQPATQEKAPAYDLYVAGLAERYSNREEAAQGCFRRALEADPSFWLARIEVARGGI